MKAVILESGTLINLSMNGLLYIIPKLKALTDVKFLITPDVKYETIERPISIPRFQLGALRIKTLLDKQQIEMSSSLDITDQDVKQKRDELMHIANRAIKAKGKWIKIVSKAEISCLALSEILTKKGIQNLISIDERTARLLAEKPQNLEKIMSRKLHQKVHLIKQNFDAFKNFKFIRSTELVYVAHKKGILRVKGPKALEATLYATKYKGSSISHDEIRALKKL